eukprot:m.78180 g.78180  ORF g.78180 m.78180 type:complete len:289 (+) comp20730_c0_seq3:37-903(+)
MSVEYLLGFVDVVEGLPADLQRSFSSLRALDSFVSANCQQLGVELDDAQPVYPYPLSPEASAKDLVTAAGQIQLPVKLKPPIDPTIPNGSQQQDETQSFLKKLKENLPELVEWQEEKTIAAEALCRHISKEAEQLDLLFDKYQSGDYLKASSPPSSPLVRKQRPSTKPPRQPEPRRTAPPRAASSQSTESRTRKRPEKEEKQVADPPAIAPPKKRRREKKNRRSEKEKTDDFCIAECTVSGGEMVGCDNKDCEKQWFHLACIGLKSAPTAKTWYCPDCRPFFDARKRR